MHKVARLSVLANYEMMIIENWLMSKGFDVYDSMDLRDGSGCSLEELEYGNDITDSLCERIENIAKERR